MQIKVGDLVQFKLEHANNKAVWKTLPKEPQHRLHFTNAQYIFRDSQDFARYFLREQLFAETEKINMIVLEDYVSVVFTRSTIPALTEAATQRFVKLMIFSMNPHQAPAQVWALENQLEEFTDKSYMETLKARLREVVGTKP